ncbi:MAG: hypothetical protein JWM02_2968 [Frankiales bacterium]|nr:hypothetical protein [Frankiales bacterium]
MRQEQRRPLTALHGLWVSVFALEALFKGSDLAHQLGAVGLGLLFLSLLITELRSQDPAQRSGTTAT